MYFNPTGHVPWSVWSHLNAFSSLFILFSLLLLCVLICLFHLIKFDRSNSVINTERDESNDVQPSDWLQDVAPPLFTHRLKGEAREKNNACQFFLSPLLSSYPFSLPLLFPFTFSFV